MPAFLVGRDENSINKPFAQYLKNLKSRISNPLRLRVGGNSLDSSFYNPNATTMFTFNVIKSNTIANQPVTYGPQVLTTIKVRQTGLGPGRGSWALTSATPTPGLSKNQQLNQDVGGTLNNLGLSFAHPYNNSDVVRFALDAQHVLGDSLDTLMLGNVSTPGRTPVVKPKLLYM